MSSDEVSQIKVGSSRVGIIGLNSVLSEVAESCAAQSDEEIRAELLKQLNQRNYIAESSREKYGQAFLRAFKKFTGRPVEEGDLDGVEIKVLGPGCTSCNKLEQDLIAVMAEMGMAADLEHVTDITEIGSYGVMGTPALVINREVKAVGSVPPKPKLKKWLQEAFARTG
ncbi:MAG: thioredoxin family protein [Deltaproteobacteria bacterium]|nr:thioredoxin family protein [Deltaproteobacteria bacterium]